MGLEGDSIQMSLVSGTIRSSMSATRLGVKVTCTSCVAATLVK